MTLVAKMEHPLLYVGQIGNIRLYYKRFVHPRQFLFQLQIYKIFVNRRQQSLFFHISPFSLTHSLTTQSAICQALPTALTIRNDAQNIWQEGG
jgi:hypothetical protein